MDKIEMAQRLKEKGKRHEELAALLEKRYSSEDAVEIKRIIAGYFWKKLTEEMDRLTIENGWTEETFEQWAHDHFRTPYNVS